MMHRSRNTLSLSSGFTLVEMLVAMVVGSILLSLIVGSYWAQSRSSRDKQMIVEMQQNMRSAMFYLTRDIRMAGYDESFQDLPGDTSILTANPTELSFQYYDADAGSTETVTYDLFDYLGDGDLDLAKTIGTVGTDPRLYIAQNVEALEFFYTLGDGEQSTAPTGDLNDIRTVGISILVRGSKMSFADESNVTHTPLSGDNTWGGTVAHPFTDGIRRQVLTTTVKCRNMFGNT